LTLDAVKPLLIKKSFEKPCPKLLIAVFVNLPQPTPINSLVLTKSKETVGVPSTPFIGISVASL